MAALIVQTFARPGRPLYEPNIEPLEVSSIIGLSSINGQPYTGGGGPVPPLPSEVSTFGVSSLAVSDVTGIAGDLSTLTVSSINGTVYPPQIAYANLVSLSSFQLPAASTFLVPFDGGITANINFTGTEAVVGVDGVYKVGCSYQFNNQSGSDVVRYFFLKNDNPLNGTASFQTVANNTEQVCYSEILEQCINGDKIQFGVYTASADIYLSTLGGPSGVPTSPASIATIYKVA